MRRRRLLWQLFPSFLVITFLSVLAVSVIASHTMRGFFRQRVQSDLESRARLIEWQIRPHTETPSSEKLQDLCRDLGRRGSLRITLIRPDGTVMADSEELPGQMDNHGNRPEVRQALAGGAGHSERHSTTLGESLMYVAHPVKDLSGDVFLVLRLAVPMTFIDHQLWSVYGALALGGLVVALIASGLSLYVAKRLAGPLEDLRAGAERFAAGDFETSLPVPNSLELGGLAEAMNDMACQLDQRIRSMAAQRSQQEAVLSSMLEGVIAVDAQGKLISLNRAAADLLRADPEFAPGRNLIEVVRNAQLLEFVEAVLSSHMTREGEIVIRDGRDRTLQLHGAVLRDEQGGDMGAVIVLNDITNLRRLEGVRRDFVANVSHELKTPITAIKGFVETLQDGALDDREDAERFLTVVANHADRLNAIIEDLMTLARVEQSGGAEQLEREAASICKILKNAISLCESVAREKGVTIHLDCPGDLHAQVNPALVEQAVVNLVDNAVKYSGEGGTVTVAGSASEKEITLRVADRGPGIDDAHLERLFERFYRVDKARSRKMGGTGLGLAIVKHIVQAHGGTVTVASKKGQGSTFTLQLPRD